MKETGSSLPGHRHDPFRQRDRPGVGRARAGRYRHVAPVEPTVDAVGQEPDPAIRRFDADLDEALVERRHGGVEGGREPLSRERPAREAASSTSGPAISIAVSSPRSWRRPPPSSGSTPTRPSSAGPARARVMEATRLSLRFQTSFIPTAAGSMGDGPQCACSADPPYGHNHSARVKCACSGPGRDSGLQGQQSSGQSRSILECQASVMI